MRLIGLVVIAMAMAGCPLEPGETRCSTTMVYGTAFTNCRSRPSEPPRDDDEDDVDRVARRPAPRPQGFWCTTGTDGSGYCVAGDRGAGLCEMLRPKLEGTGATFAPCAFQPVAICSPIGCFANPATCAAHERNVGRDGSACAVRR